MSEINVTLQDTNPELLLRLRNQIDNIPITIEVARFYAQHAAETKEKVNQLAAEIHQRQDKMRLINEIISEINQITDEKNCLDISKNSQLQEKLAAAKELGVKLFENKTTYSAIERDRLIENLHLAADKWDKENRNQTQKMEIHVKELDRIIMLLKEVQKSEDKPKRSSIAGMKGG